jgi:hypothetical protein
MFPRQPFIIWLDEPDCAEEDAIVVSIINLPEKTIEVHIHNTDETLPKEKLPIDNATALMYTENMMR